MTFDLQAAREIAIKLTLRYPAKELIDVDYQNALAGEMLPGACEEIARLDHEVSVARNLASLAKGIVDEQSARIKQLEGWLVEERANLLYITNKNPREKFRCLSLDMPDKKKEYLDRAREQLQAEDKL